MSSQRGNTSRTRPQKHQNSKVFKNNLHDKSKKTQIINNTQIKNSCDKCKAIIEWKIKYKKYKQLKSAKTCIKCSNKSVKQSYHTICEACVIKLKICAKCGTSDFRNSDLGQSSVIDKSTPTKLEHESGSEGEAECLDSGDDDFDSGDEEDS